MGNLEYIAARNKLIPEAEKFADEIAGLKPPMRRRGQRTKSSLQQWGDRWNRCFFDKMNRLVRERGV